MHRRFDHRQGHENSLSLTETLLAPKTMKDVRDDDREDRQVRRIAFSTNSSSISMLVRATVPYLQSGYTDIRNGGVSGKPTRPVGLCCVGLRDVLAHRISCPDPLQA
jgi:hypothetical protein